MNVLLLTSHSIAEYDDLRMLSDLGYDVFSIGAYTDPAHPGDDMRPALPDVPHREELAALCESRRRKHEGQPTDWAIDWAKADLHPALIDWADAIIVHHFPERWIAAQWERIRGKRVIWRTCGQSGPDLERLMGRLRGLEIVRYSPAEKRAFEHLGAFAGETAMIRFGKYPEDWTGWTGSDNVVINVTQDLAGRGDFTHYDFWQAATQGLPAMPLGKDSEKIGGPGAMPYDDMRARLRAARAYLYTGTQPASYTLALIEAMMTGTPVVSIPKSKMWLPDLFEGDELVLAARDAEEAHGMLAYLLSDPDAARDVSKLMRIAALDLFGIAGVGKQWRSFLGSPVPAVVAA